MIAGHFGFAAIVKAKEPRTPLWALMLACQWLDVVFVPLFLLGLEKLEPVPGSTGGYGEVIIFADYTHSLVGALLLSVLFGVATGIPWGRRCGVVLGAVSFSHWVLDLLVHRHDMPLVPGNAAHLHRLGFGLWESPAASALVELTLVIAGAWLYRRAAVAALSKSSQGTGRANLVAGLALAFGILTLALNLAGL